MLRRLIPVADLEKIAGFSTGSTASVGEIETDPAVIPDRRREHFGELPPSASQFDTISDSFIRVAGSVSASVKRWTLTCCLPQLGEMYLSMKLVSREACEEADPSLIIGTQRT